ncbi:MAG: hypothetical protein M3389_00075 [Actinomycetota bacterium]|nr:hypothetical protein [Actinomycetota bacterium]
MSRQAAVTVGRPREEVERLWRELGPGEGAAATFKDAPGDRGTEVYLEVEQLATGKDTLRRFKQRVETGEIARSEAI